MAAATTLAPSLFRVSLFLDTNSRCKYCRNMFWCGKYRYKSKSSVTGVMMSKTLFIVTVSSFIIITLGKIIYFLKGLFLELLWHFSCNITVWPNVLATTKKYWFHYQICKKLRSIIKISISYKKLVVHPKSHSNSYTIKRRLCNNLISNGIILISHKGSCLNIKQKMKIYIICSFILLWQ